MEKNYKIFTRNWWKLNPSWPEGKEPDSNARKTIIGYASTQKEARDICQKHNDNNDHGVLGNKAEYTRN